MERFSLPVNVEAILQVVCLVLEIYANSEKDSKVETMKHVLNCVIRYYGKGLLYFCCSLMNNGWTALPIHGKFGFSLDPGGMNMQIVKEGNTILDISFSDTTTPMWPSKYFWQAIQTLAQKDPKSTKIKRSLIEFFKPAISELESWNCL